MTRCKENSNSQTQILAKQGAKCKNHPKSALVPTCIYLLEDCSHQFVQDCGKT